jgi:hypothetical protein
VGINKAEAQERLPRRRTKKQTISEALDGGPPLPLPRPWGSTPPRESFSGLEEFLSSGYFRSMVVKPDGEGGGTFTLKGVLEMWTPSPCVYMHGTIASLEMLPSVLDDLLRKGCWRVDQYAKPPARDR